MSATQTNGVPETFTLKVNETHLDKAIARFKVQGTTEPIGHGRWCVMAQAGKEIDPDSRSGLQDMWLKTSNYVPVDSFGLILYRDIAQQFDRAQFDELRKMLPVEIPMKRRDK